jgi:hypothetical protein
MVDSTNRSPRKAMGTVAFMNELKAFSAVFNLVARGNTEESTAGTSEKAVRSSDLEMSDLSVDGTPDASAQEALLDK